MGFRIGRWWICLLSKLRGGEGLVICFGEIGRRLGRFGLGVRSLKKGKGQVGFGDPKCKTKYKIKRDSNKT